MFQRLEKLLELLKQAVSAVTRVALLMKPDAAPDSTLKQYVKSAEDAARVLALGLQVVHAGGPQDFDRAFADMTKARAGAVAVVATRSSTAPDNGSWSWPPSTGCRQCSP